MVWSWTSPVSSSETKMQVVSLLLLLGLGARGQPGASGQCPGPRECIKQAQCPAFVSQWEELKRLAQGSAEYEALLEKLKGEVCDQASRRVWCNPVGCEISGGDGYTEPHEFPFMVCITVRVSTREIWVYLSVHIPNGGIMRCETMSSLVAGRCKVLPAGTALRRGTAGRRSGTAVQAAGTALQ